MLISIGDIITRSFNLCKDNFMLVLKYLLLSLTASVASVLVLSYALMPIMKRGAQFGPIIFVLVPFIALALLAISLLGMLFNFALIKTLDALYKKTPVPSVRDTVSVVKKTFWRGVGTMILTGIYTALPFAVGFFGIIGTKFGATLSGLELGSPVIKMLNSVFAIIAVYGFFHMIYFSIRLIFAVYSAVLDGQTIPEAVKTSKSLSRNRWWRVFGRLFVPALVAYVALGIANVLFASIGGLVGGDIGKIIASILTSFASLLVATYGMAVVIILFNEAKNG